MGDESRLTRGLASGFVLAGGAAICAWMWPEDGSLITSGAALLAFVVSVAVVASVWKK
jgi:hypothetical protein